METMFQAPFPKCRPNWLKPPGARRSLELDGFNDCLRVAFEYQGVQHYEPRGHFRPEDVERIKARDTEKRKLCWWARVSLIVVPEFCDLSNTASAINQIELAVSTAGLHIPRGWNRGRLMQLPALWS
jgi:hypothetical protein